MTMYLEYTPDTFHHLLSYYTALYNFSSNFLKLFHFKIKIKSFKKIEFIIVKFCKKINLFFFLL